MKIDVHAHIVDRTYLDSLSGQLGLRAATTEDGKTLLRKESATVAWSRPEFFDVAARLEAMDRQGVDMRVLSLSSPSIYDWPGAEQRDLARWMNDAIGDVCNAHPTRFRGLATLPLADSDAAIAELARICANPAFVGIAVGSHIAGMPLNDSRLEPVWAEVDARRVPVVQHPMAPLGAEHLNEFELPLRVGFIYETTTAVTRMIYGGVFERYPNFPFVVAHTGGALLSILERLDNGYRLFPDCRQFIRELPSTYAKKLYYDSCSFSEPTLMLAREIVGSERILWGSDDPFIGADMEHVRRLPIPDREKNMILGGNAAAIFGIAG